MIQKIKLYKQQKLNTPKDYILIKANSQDSKYIVEISADNNKWQNIGSDLNEVKRIDIQGVTDKIYLKITLNDSKIEGIEIYE